MGSANPDLQRIFNQALEQPTPKALEVEVELCRVAVTVGRRTGGTQ
jgi:hypothetical protein